MSASFPPVTIREASDSDHMIVLDLFRAIISEGETYIYTEDFSDEALNGIWFEAPNRAYVVEHEGTVIASFVIRPNKMGRGAHIANAAFIVQKNYQGKGIGRLMGEYAIDEAKRLGYRAMQFNIVVSTNIRSVSLWNRLGFRIIGTIPEGFDHKQLGLVDIYIMYRSLEHK